MLGKSDNKFAIIDLGSNSFHMVLGSIVTAERERERERKKEALWKIDQQMHESVQLRAGITPYGELTESSMNRAISCIAKFSEKLIQFKPDPDKVCIVGTAALRLAKNRELFISQASKKLGYPIEIISGEKEAEFIYQAFVQHLQLQPHQKILAIDVGGGSTELAVGLGQDLKASLSFPLGCVELQPYFVGAAGWRAENFSLAKQCVQEKCQEVEKEIQAIVGVAWEKGYAGSGSAQIVSQMMSYLGIEAGNEGGEITYDTLMHIQNWLISLKERPCVNTLSLKLTDPQWRILPGVVVIFLALMECLKLDKIRVLPVTLRHGILAVMQKATLPPLVHNN